MKDRTLENSIVKSLQGALNPEESKALTLRLKNDPSAQQLHSEYRALLAIQDSLATSSPELEASFATSVMRTIKEQRKDWGIVKFLRTLALTFPPTAVGIAALLLCITLFETPGGGYSSSPGTISGSTSGSFSEAAFEDDLVRSSVGNLFKLIEGAVGALVITLSLLAALGAFLMKFVGGEAYYKTGIVFLNIALCAFILRWLVAFWFGVPVDY